MIRVMVKHSIENKIIFDINNLHFVAFLLHIVAFIYNSVVYLLHNYHKMTCNYNNLTVEFSIMEMATDELSSYCLKFLRQIDDYQQMSHDIITEENDTQYFVDSYYRLESLYNQVQTGQVTPQLRDEIRSVCKGVMKMAMVQFGDPKEIN